VSYAIPVMSDSRKWPTKPKLFISRKLGRQHYNSSGKSGVYDHVKLEKVSASEIITQTLIYSVNNSACHQSSSSAAHCRSSLLSTVQSSLYSLQFISVMGTHLPIQITEIPMSNIIILVLLL